MALAPPVAIQRNRRYGSVDPARRADKTTRSQGERVTYMTA